ncbi:gliding motility-associated C-terminal domain-containing protein [Flavobacterium sp. SM2513]|uniref:T9SS type B sorting domain-containing protein n=1 Tax=Flavobacterium sp. SM2513 TaxID=3424766 RepID=UPI003D7F997B
MQQIIKREIFNKICILFFILFCSVSLAQLPDFTFSVIKTNETCESNGTLAFSVQNTAPGSVITYSIYLLPNSVNPITVTTQNSYTGLNSGNYLIVAAQNLSGQTNSQQQSVSILDQVVSLEYQLQGQNAVCINNGEITVLVTQGQAANYEIISGPILKPLQQSNIFTGLSAGIYLVRVYDNCGNGVVQTYTLFESPSSIDISPVNTITIIDCDHAIINQTISAGDGVIFYPLNLVYTVTLPSGEINAVTQTLTSGNDNFITIAQNIPITIGETVTYTLNIVDGCGTVFNGSGSLSVPLSTPSFSTVPNGCGNNNYSVKNASNVLVIEAPALFIFTLPYSVPTSGNNTYPMNNYPPGNYKLEITDLCGLVTFVEFAVTASTVSPPVISVRLGCENGLGSIKIAGQVNIISAQLIQAPNNAGFSVPMDVSSLLYGSPQGLHMNNLISGVYSFLVVDECGNSHNLSATIQSYQEVKTVIVFENCGSFDLFLNQITTPNISMSYQLQKFYTNGNFWGEPITGAQEQGLTLTNNTTKYNIASSGHFRIIGKNFIYGNGGPSVNCILVIDEFDFYSLPKINSVFSFACDAGGFDVFVDAVGVSDLKYRIVAKNGVPLFINNLIDPLFTNLAAATYTFQVEDGCNNILIADFEVGSTQNFPILKENLCPQQNATLSVDNFYFLSYQWWKGSDASTILSTTNSLSMPNFNPTADSGMYHVRIYYTASPNSCIDIQQEYLIEVSDYVLNAGENTTKSYCGSPGIIDLFSVLNGNPDANGIWTDLSNTGFLSDSTWNATSVNQGIYNFKYSLTGLCNEMDSALVQITINTIPDTISITVNPIICAGETIVLNTDFVANTSYFWQGPNGFSSSLQNPTIENANSLNSGNYSLNMTVNNCELEPVEISIEVKSVPDFYVTGSCVRDDSDYELKAEPVGLNINSDEFTYSWNGPSGYLGSENPISILGKEGGMYTLIIADSDGCSIKKSYEVKGTICRIPKGISPNNDGDNDSFDLAGFDVKNIVIYSRYGRIVFQKKNYLNEWHGQDYKERNLPAATYYYHIETFSGEEFVGWVYVIR